MLIDTFDISYTEECFFYHVSRLNSNHAEITGISQQ